jgi:hypothetical protein
VPRGSPDQVSAGELFCPLQRVKSNAKGGDLLGVR